MNNYTISNDITKEIESVYNAKKKEKNLSDIVGQIDAINNSFGLVDIPDYVEPDLKRMEELSYNSEDIKKQAEDSLSDYKSKTLSGIEEEISKKEYSLNANKDVLKENIDNQKSSIRKNYNNAKESASNDALKRGLARSSIVVNILDAFDKEELSKITELDKDYMDTMSAIDFELMALTQEKQKAINDFDIEYAVKLNDKIAALNSEFSKKQSEILKYNNDIAEKEKEYQDKYNSLVVDIQNKNISNASDQLELINKYGSKAISNYTKNQIFKVLDNYFADKSKGDIELDLNSNELKSVLGDNFSEVYSRYL